jgi:hypothetical protein
MLYIHAWKQVFDSTNEYLKIPTRNDIISPAKRTKYFPTKD